jgi:CheY-like chemotaxis protein
VGTTWILQARGDEVRTAGDGLEAMEVFEREGDGVDVVVTDVVMPRVRGDELARTLAGRRPDVPIILMPGCDQAIREVVDARV